MGKLQKQSAKKKIIVCEILVDGKCAGRLSGTEAEIKKEKARLRGVAGITIRDIE